MVWCIGELLGSPLRWLLSNDGCDKAHTKFGDGLRHRDRLQRLHVTSADALSAIPVDGDGCTENVAHIVHIWRTHPELCVLKRLQAEAHLLWQPAGL